MDCASNRYLKSIFIVNERIRSLVDDGYLLLFSHVEDTKAFHKLVHRINGNTVFLAVDYAANSLRQMSKGRLVYDGPIV